MKLKRLAIIFSLLLVVFFGAGFFAKKAKAALTLQDWLNDTEMGEGNMEQWQDEGWPNDFYSLLTMMIGRDSLEGLANSGTSRGIYNMGAIPFASSMVGLVYAKPPASGALYIADTLQTIGGKQAYAQGTGFTGLQPILPIWKAFRNVAYSLLTIVFVVIGVAIMFRTKISPQAVITVGNAIPRLIGALILITFSYAIAGFVIDFMYVLMALGINILIAAGVQPSMFNFYGANILPFTPQQTIEWGFFGFIPMFLSNKPGISALAAIIGGVIGAIGGAVFGGGAGAIPGTFLGIGSSLALVTLIILIISLFLIFKLLFGLIKAYIKIIVLVMFGPIQIISGAIPGLQSEGLGGGFGGWLKSLFVETLIFPAVALIGMIAAYLLQQTSFSAMWSAPLIGFPGGTAAGGVIATNFTQAIIGMGFLLMMANIPDIVRNAMGKKDMGHGSMLGKTFAGPAGILSTTAKMGAQVSAGYGLDIAEQRAASRGLPQLQGIFKNIHQAAKNLRISS